ncbi:MAG: ATP-binding cassette, subfamily bacterial MsbA, partial [Pseudomonadota bacterium]|nr:ATP-binding cassette, subfamily bacterial MsbA [Pseudomonadota bacterium]
MQQTSPKQASSLKIYLRLLSYLRPFVGLFAVSIVGYMIFASSQPMLAAVLKYFVDGLGAPAATTHHPFPLIGNVQLMYGVPILLVIIIFWRSVGSFLGNYYLARVSLGLVNDLRIALFYSLLRLPNAYFDQQNSGLLIS